MISLHETWVYILSIRIGIIVMIEYITKDLIFAIINTICIFDPSIAREDSIEIIDYSYISKFIQMIQISCMEYWCFKLRYIVSHLIKT